MAGPALREPVTHRLEFGAGRGVTLNVLRGWPCAASGTGAVQETCGATPASLWWVFCANGHRRQARLCGNHALLAGRGHVACRECADKGTAGRVFLLPVDLVLLGVTGQADERMP